MSTNPRRRAGFATGFFRAACVITAGPSEAAAPTPQGRTSCPWGSAGRWTGRTYTIVYRGFDASGNTRDVAAYVQVPHQR